VFDFARFSYDNVIAEDATSWRYSTSALLGPTRSLRSPG
jgi:hypothetical protein